MAATPTSLTEQQMQPLASGTKGMGVASVALVSETVSCFSMSMAGEKGGKGLDGVVWGIAIYSLTHSLSLLFSSSSFLF